MRKLINTALQICFYLIFTNTANAQNEIKLLNKYFTTGIDPIDDTQLTLYYNYTLKPSIGDTFIVQLNYKDGKIFSSKFITSNSYNLFEKQNETVIAINTFLYTGNGNFDIGISSSDKDFFNICEAKIFLVSKLTKKTYKADNYTVSICGLNFNDRSAVGRQKLFREDEKSFKIYGMNEQSQLQIYNILGKIIEYRIIRRDVDFYEIELTESIIPAFVVLNGVVQKI